MLAFARGLGPAIVNSITNLEYLQPNYWWPFPRLRYRKQEFMFQIMGHVTITGQPSQGPSQQWTIALLTPLSTDWTIGPKAYRKLRRARLSLPTGYLKGPRSLANVRDNWPTLSDKWLRPHNYDSDGNSLGPIPGSEIRPPHVFMGDPTPEDIHTYDYQPSDSDCTDDVEPAYEDIFDTQSVED